MAELSCIAVAEKSNCHQFSVKVSDTFIFQVNSAKEKMNLMSALQTCFGIPIQKSFTLTMVQMDFKYLFCEARVQYRHGPLLHEHLE